MSVSPRVYLETTRAHLTKYSVHVTRGRGYRSFSVDTEIRYVIPVLWMTACFHIADLKAAWRYGCKQRHCIVVLIYLQSHS